MRPRHGLISSASMDAYVLHATYRNFLWCGYRHQCFFLRLGYNSLPGYDPGLVVLEILQVYRIDQSGPTSGTRAIDLLIGDQPPMRPQLTVGLGRV